MYNNKSNDTEKVIAVTIEKIKRIYASTAIYKFSQGLKNAETDDFDSAFDNVLDFFGNKIEEDALKIECSGYDVPRFCKNVIVNPSPCNVCVCKRQCRC